MINSHSGVPRHLQLADILRARLAAGEWAPGEPLPSETRLTQEYGVGRGTVRRAVALLRADGLVDVAPGRGTRVREPMERQRVSVPRGAEVTGRLPTPTERARLDIPEGVPVLVVSIGGRERVYPADRTTLTIR
ncbi:GntR family transcriptional regulator [Micromonospora zhanjiangensis]|uniref:GntR family transcriptional regulator n=1 Tax=Micromonospora zhanjiangensis TaxID=1522057 RepID=A0ABV8KNV8_9ACTN